MAKIAFIVYATGWGGTEVHTLAWARALQGRGHEVTIAALNQQAHAMYSEAGLADFEVLQLPVPKDISQMTWRDWRSTFLSLDAALVVMVKGGFHLGTIALDLAARLSFQCFVTIEHLTGDPVPARTSKWHWGMLPGLGIWWYKQRLANFGRSLGPSRVICVSDRVRQRLVDDYLYPPGKTCTIHNGIDVGRFQFCPEARQRWRDQLGVAGTSLVFGAIGRLKRVKGYDVAIACFQKFLCRFPSADAKLVLVGDGELRDAMLVQAGALSKSGAFVILPFTDKPWEALSGIDVFLMPSLNEGMPLSLLEAMACERCVIATDVGGNGEVLSSSELGWLVPALDPEAFLSAMVAAFELQSHERAAMGVKARCHIHSHFRAETQFNKLADEIESICPPSPSRFARRHQVDD